MIVSEAASMTGSNGPRRFASARSALALNHRLNVSIDRAGDPDTGLIVEGAGGGVDHGKNGGGGDTWGGIAAPAVLWCLGEHQVGKALGVPCPQLA